MEGGGNRFKMRNHPFNGKYGDTFPVSKHNNSLEFPMDGFEGWIIEYFNAGLDRFLVHRGVEMGKQAGR